MSSVHDAPIVTLAEDRPVHDLTATTVLRGPKPKGEAPTLLGDTQLIETSAHFPQERIPERVVHSKAAGAWGEFEGSSGTTRDIRGFAPQMFTEEGNWDFFEFPSLNRSHQCHPPTDVPDSTMFWDFHINNQEGVHCLMQLFGGRGILKSLRHINGFDNHTFKVGKPEDGTFKYVKIHFKPDYGIWNLDSDEAVELAGEEPDYDIEDLYDAIERGDYPSWTIYFQIMDPKEAETCQWDFFDITKIWPQRDYPLMHIGRLTLNRNPDNHFQDVGQAAFSPSTMVPGIGPSADPVLQARMFSYPDAAKSRLDPKYVYSPYQRDGPMRVDGNYGGDPDYTDIAHDEWIGKKMFKSNGEDKIFAKNVAAHVGKALPQVQKATKEMFNRVDKEVGEAIQKALDELDSKGGA
ncbi:catalase-like domain-containing protein [Triangularia verruculosa]|uniref:Catalase-like domain-containing protein n=1 Tax=Triangularia verruculosa TaxID=2587418 RepID=A0AAN6XMZ0_9PEZI|nr:catalase-like domain-containing protein [Triangularia verruculosa]